MKQPPRRLPIVDPISRRRFLKLAGGAGLGGLTAAVSGRTPTAAWDEGLDQIRDADLVLTGLKFSGGQGQGTRPTSSGLAVESSAGRYTSAVFDAPIPFNAIVPRWKVDLPENAAFELQLRSANAAGEWSEWYHCHFNHDWTPEESDSQVGDMVVVSAADGVHTRFQFMLELDGEAAGGLVEELRFTCIDSTRGPTTEELTAGLKRVSPLAAQTASSYPRPPVVPRSHWCYYTACNYGGLRYSPVTHLILHHTVTGNGSADWPSVVRAIWSYHVNSNGWEDIGYNYLVDQNGTLYEGHLGGDDVIGIHAGNANAGTMALALIGTFSTASDPLPPWAMRNSAAELFAWKADQKGIDVYDAGPMPYMDWGLPRLMGHRDVYGTTTCPGDRAFELLPWLRDEVARRIDLQHEYIYVDELSSGFVKSNANWYTGPHGCGNNGHSYYTYSTTNPAESTNWGEWTLPIVQEGWHEVQVYAPFGRTLKRDTLGARYVVKHANDWTTKVVNQEANLGLWVSLGTYYFKTDSDRKVYLSDLVTTDNGYGLWFDAIRIRPQFSLPVVSAAGQQPANQWKTSRTVQFSWTLNNPVVVQQVTVQAAADPGFGSLLLSRTLDGAATSFSHDFGADTSGLYWRLVVKTVQNQFITAEAAGFGVDSTPPTSSAAMLYEPAGDRFLLALSGSDATSGVANFDVEYRLQGLTQWQTLQNGVSGSALEFEPPIRGAVYEFRVRARDWAGNLEAAHAAPDSRTNEAIVVDKQTFLPLIRRGS